MELCKYCGEKAHEEYEFCSLECKQDYIDSIPLKLIGRMIMFLGIFLMIYSSDVYPAHIAFLCGIPMALIIYDTWNEYILYYHSEKKKKSNQ